MKFKVGDRVKVIKNIDSWDTVGLFGNIIEIYEDGQYQCKVKHDQTYSPNRDTRTYRYENLALVSPVNTSKIVITTDGKTTLARLYDGNKVVKSAKAKCSPDYTYDFATGANLAYDRLMRPAAKTEDKPEPAEPVKLYCVKDYGQGKWLTKGKVYNITDGLITYDSGWQTNFTGKNHLNGHAVSGYWCVPLVKRPAKQGEWVCISKSSSERFIGTIGKVVDFAGKQPKINHERVWFSSNPDGTEDTVISVHTEYLVLDGFTPEEPAKQEPKFYSGKVVCVDNYGNLRQYTVGKIYVFKDGVITLDTGATLHQRFTSFKEFNDFTSSEFVEIIGEQA